MARPRKPTAMLALNGAFIKNPQRLDARKDEPKFEKGIGDPPEWLDEGAQNKWREIAPQLENAGVVSRVESDALACYCQNVSRLIAANKDIARAGMYITTPQGSLAKHPAVNISRECSMIVARLANEFGITPASRSRVNAKNSGEGKNEFSEI